MRLVGVLSSGALVASVLVLPQVAAGPAAAAPEVPGVGWQYSEEGQGFYRQPTGEAPHQDGPAMVMVEVDNPWYCNDRPGCDGFVSHTCGGLGPADRPWFVHATFRREPEDGGELGPWTFEDSECIEVTDDDWIPVEEFSYRVDFEVFQPLGEPNLELSPNPRGLVNLPVVMSTDYPEGLPGPGRIESLDPTVIRVPIEIERPGGGLTGEIVARADYTWTFEGGGSATGRGKPYTRSVDPRRAGGYYVSKAFGTTGTKDVHLNVRWTGTVTVGGLDPEPIDPVEIDADATVEVVEASAVLRE